jgi:hypothetical protein
MHGGAQRRRAGTAATLAAGLLWLSHAAACESGARSSAYDLSGYVVTERESAGREPVSGARVRFTSDTGLVTETVASGAGRYEMQVESDVRFGQVRAEADGFVPQEATVYFDSAERRLDLVMRRTAD